MMTAAASTAAPSTATPTTEAPTIALPTTAAPTTAAQTTAAPTTAAPTVAVPTTVALTTAAPTTAAPITVASTTVTPTIALPTGAAPTTSTPMTAPPTNVPPTTAAPSTASPSTTSPSTAVHQYTISADLPEEPYSDALTDPSSSEYKDLEKRVVAMCVQIYIKKFQLKFIYCVVIKFSPQTLRTAGVNATLGIGFNGTVPIAQLPSNAEVTRTFADALNNSNNTFNVTVNPNSLTVLDSPVTDATTTASPATVAPTTSAPTTAAPTTAAPTTAATTTAAPTTSPPTTAATTTVALITIRVTFRSLQSTFTSDLLNPSSTAFKQRAAMIKGQLDPVFHKGFPSSFKSLVVLSFSNGSVINLMDLVFVNSSAPNDTQIASVLSSAAQNVTGFDIETASIYVNGIISSGVSHKISLITAFCLVLLSWLLSSQQ
ncbi:uncharacterized protein LOC144459785 [Epinephelus lanceolatus]